MKIKFPFLFIVLLTIASCQHISKNPIEERFDEYLKSQNLTEDFVGIDSIAPLDSLNLISHYEKIVNIKDSVHDALMNEIKAITDNMDKLKSQDFSEALALATNLPQINRPAEEKEISEKISIFLEDIPEKDAWYKTYKIVAKFNDGLRTYYANNVAFEDTIIISNDLINCNSRKSKRILGYFDSYITDVYAPQAVFLENAKNLHSKILQSPNIARTNPKQLSAKKEESFPMRVPLEYPEDL